MGKNRRKFYNPGREFEYEDDFVERSHRDLISRFEDDYVSEKRDRKRQARRARRRDKEAFLEY